MAVGLHLAVFHLTPGGERPPTREGVTFFELSFVDEDAASEDDVRDAPTDIPIVEGKPAEGFVDGARGEGRERREREAPLDARGRTRRSSRNDANASASVAAAFGVIEALRAFEPPAASVAYVDAAERERLPMPVVSEDFFCGTASLGRGASEVFRSASGESSPLGIVPIARGRPWRRLASVATVSNVTTIDICGRPETDWCRRWPHLSNAIRRALARERPRIQRCYEEALVRAPSLEGRLVLSIRAGTDRTVTDVTIARSTVSASSVERCVTDVVLGIEMPLLDEAIRFTYPISFTRRDDDPSVQ